MNALKNEERVTTFEKQLQELTRGETLEVKRQLADQYRKFGNKFSEAQTERFYETIDVIEQKLIEKEFEIVNKLQQHFIKRFDAATTSKGMMNGNFHFELENGTPFRVQPTGKHLSNYQVQCFSDEGKEWNRVFDIKQQDVEPKVKKEMAVEISR